ncbi:MAG: hypothetical protein PHC64_04695 [Candidatus Gastranaerophilales bacterium]|nr:hypothetical protein [Candidatus Gastranaerophilales bacterium]
MKIPIKCKKCGYENKLKLDSVHFNLKQRKMILWEENKLDDFKLALKEKIMVFGLNDYITYEAAKLGDKSNKLIDKGNK